MMSIGRVCGRQSSSVFSMISPTGGIRLPDRIRGKFGLRLWENEEISRGLSMKQCRRHVSLRSTRALPWRPRPRVSVPRRALSGQLDGLKFHGNRSSMRLCG